MNASDDQEVRATGRCLCGAVKYEVRGPLRDVINCHCEKCRRTHGHAAAYTRARLKDLVLLETKSLKWYRSIYDETPNVYRGFCTECGASLFWEPRGQDFIAIAAGSLDPPTGLKTIGHIWLDQAGDYYELSDELPKFSMGWGSGPGGGRPGD